MTINNIKKLLVLVFVFWFYNISYADTASFGVEVSPTKAWVWEALDVTIKALDKDWNIDKTYAWEVLIFSETDPKAEFPWELAENTYKFKTSDQWQVKFENAVKFTKAWVQNVNVFDISNDDIFWSADIEISQGEVQTSSGEIKITSPDTWTTLGENKLKVNWTTLKNHQVVVMLNTDKKFETISNSDWVFEVEITDIPAWENSLKAQVLDASKKVIWTSSDVLIKIDNQAPVFKEVKVSPKNPVVSEGSLDVEVYATSWLTEVNVLLNDVIEKLTEKENGVYVWKITAPKEAWSYKMDVILKNELWLETKQNWAYELTVEAVELDAATATWTASDISCEDLAKDATIKWVNLTKMKSKSVLSWDKLDNAASYNVYKKNRETSKMELVQNVTEPRVEINITWDKVEYDDFAIKAVLNDEKCNWTESKDFSDMTKVQTWPQEMILALFALLTAAWMFYLKRRKIS